MLRRPSPIFLVCAALMLLAAFAVWQGLKTLQDLRAMESHAAALEASINGAPSAGGLGAQVERASAELGAMDANATDLEADVGPVMGLATFLEPLPVVGGDAAASPHLLAMLHRATSIARRMLPLASALTQSTGKDSTNSSRLSLITRALDSNHSQLAAARQDLQALEQERRQIDTANVSPRVRRYLELFDTLSPMLDEGLQAAPLLAEGLGAHGTRRYLLVFQNADEIRATGGYISSAGVATLKGGELVSLTFADSASLTDYSKPHPASPEPLVRHANTGLWIFRDANWSPDFPSAARTMEQLYEIETGVATDGVMAVDEAGVVQLLDLVGGVQLVDYQVHVGSGNMLALARQFYSNPLSAANGQQYAHRKDFMGEVMRTFVQRLQTSPLDLRGWANKLPSLVQQGHLLFYMNEPALEALLKSHELDGQMHAGSGEYLQWVDSNVGYNKADANVQRSLAARVTLKANEPAQLAVTMTYTNTTPATGGECVRALRYADYAALAADCDWNYARMYVPKDAEFVSAEGQFPPELQSPEGEAQLPGFGMYLIVPRGSTKSIGLQYRSAPLVGGTFQLYLQKQAGVRSLPVSFEVDFPEQWKIQQLSPAPIGVTAGVVVFDAVMTADQQFRIEFAGQ